MTGRSSVYVCALVCVLIPVAQLITATRIVLKVKVNVDLYSASP